MSRYSPFFVNRTMILAFAVATPPPAAILAQALAPKPPGKPSALDQQLLQDLDRQLLEGVPPGSKSAPPSGPSSDQDRKPATPDPQNPLAKVAQRMRAVENRIAQHDISSATQGEQQQIARDLALLLEQARQRQSADSNSSKGGGRGINPAGIGTGDPIAGPPRDSTDRIERGTKEAVETAEVKDLMRRMWGHLPDKMRDQMQAALSERFLPKYERLIEDYYKRLAEERPAGP
jgi:hypothetical protein